MQLPTRSVRNHTQCESRRAADHFHHCCYSDLTRCDLILPCGGGGAIEHRAAPWTIGVAGLDLTSPVYLARTLPFAHSQHTGSSPCFSHTQHSHPLLSSFLRHEPHISRIRSVWRPATSATPSRVGTIQLTPSAIDATGEAMEWRT